MINSSEKAKDYAKSVQEVSKVTEDLMAPLDAASKKENVKAEQNAAVKAV